MHMMIIKMGYQPRGAFSPIFGIKFSRPLFFFSSCFNFSLELICAPAFLISSYSLALYLFLCSLYLLLSLQ